MTAVGTSAQSATNVRPVQVAQGEKQKIRGSSVFAPADSFKVETWRAEVSVLLTADTKVSSHRKVLEVRRNTQLLTSWRGLRLQAQGTGDAQGNLVAEWVRFDEQDLRALSSGAYS